MLSNTCQTIAINENSLVLNRSSAKYVPISSGFNICPRGFILALEASSAKGAARLGVCTICSSGTYSVNPLYGGVRGGEVMGDSESPKCLACPAGGICFGGDKVVQ
jgi:hypothetical protein